MSRSSDAARPDPSVADVFAVALRLGLTSFGGPVAHIGYFERTYVRRLRWLSSEEFAQVIALAQLMPGLASSQTGFLIGLRKAGWWGAVAAFAGFTLPSAVLMLAFATAAAALDGPWWLAVLHGLS